jgi:NADH:ubiquinone oxidoreductase subunit E
MVKVVKDYLQDHHAEDLVDFRGGHCFGACHLGPVIEIDGEVFEKLTEESLIQLLDTTLNRQKE